MDFITIRTFQDYFSAHILLTKLKDAGVECYLMDEFTVTADPILSNAVGGIKLVVKKEDEEQAALWLQQFDKEYRKNSVCPRCGSATIERIAGKTPANRLTAILTWLFGGYAISARNIYHCSSCGYESESFPENFADNVIPEENLN
jgi:predicted RNA-binding Zn-ribbon protein involved in translation (DUF1610 family)